MSLVTASPAVVTRAGSVRPSSQSGNFPSFLPASFPVFSATFSSAGSTVSTVSCSEIGERLSATNFNNEKNFTKLQAFPVTIEAPVTVVPPPNALPSPVHENAPVPDESQKVVGVLDICTIEDNNTLSPDAPVWLPALGASNSSHLYPPGKNSAGAEYKISDDAWVAIEFGEILSCQAMLRLIWKRSINSLKIKLPCQVDPVFLTKFFLQLPRIFVKMN